MDRSFFFVLCASAGLVISVIGGLYWHGVPDGVRESRYQEVRDRTQLFLQRPTDPEPKLPLRWAFEYSLPLLQVRSLFELSPAQLQRLEQLTQRGRRLFDITFALPRTALPLMELRVVHNAILNDDRYFDIDRGTEGSRYYGRYFVGHHIGYVTEQGFNDNTHIVHEYCHFLTDAHGLTRDKPAEERRARWFAEYFDDYETYVDAPHRQTYPSPPGRWAFRRQLAAGLALRSTRALEPEETAAIARSVSRAQLVFSREYSTRPTTDDNQSELPAQVRVSVVPIHQLEAGRKAEARADGLWLSYRALGGSAAAIDHAMFHLLASRADLHHVFIHEELEAHAMAFHQRVVRWRTPAGDHLAQRQDAPDADDN